MVNSNFLSCCLVICSNTDWSTMFSFHIRVQPISDAFLVFKLKNPSKAHMQRESAYGVYGPQERYCRNILRCLQTVVALSVIQGFGGSTVSMSEMFKTCFCEY